MTDKTTFRFPSLPVSAVAHPTEVAQFAMVPPHI